MEEESLPTPDDHGSNPVIDNSNELSTVLKIHNKKSEAMMHGPIIKDKLEKYQFNLKTVSKWGILHSRHWQKNSAVEHKFSSNKSDFFH